MLKYCTISGGYCKGLQGGGAAHKVEPDRCHLAGVDFLGAMEVDLWSRSAKKHKENKRGSRKGSKMAGVGKNYHPRGYLWGPKYSPLRRG